MVVIPFIEAITAEYKHMRKMGLPNTFFNARNAVQAPCQTSKLSTES